MTMIGIVTPKLIEKLGTEYDDAAINIYQRR